MKKIIATVLAMVMALALCTVAFATNVTDLDGNGYAGYNKAGNEITTGTVYGYEAVAAAFTKATGAGNVAHYKVYTVANDAATEYGTYVKADKTDFDLKLTKSGAATLYLKEVVSANYVAKAEAFTKIGNKCGMLDEDTDRVYYVSTSKYTVGGTTKDAGEVYFVQLEDEGQTNVLVNGKLVSVEALANAELVGHTWVAVEKDGKVVSYKCSDCGQTAAIYKTKDAAKASGLKNIEAYVDDEGNSIFLAWTDGKTTCTTTYTNKPSPKTFDAGIAMYVGMALTSVAGSAVVIGKKKEF